MAAGLPDGAPPVAPVAEAAPLCRSSLKWHICRVHRRAACDSRCRREETGMSSLEVISVFLMQGKHCGRLGLEI